MSLRVMTTPWVRGAMTDTEREFIHVLRDEEEVDGHLSLLADSPRGPYIGILTRPGFAQERTWAPSLAGVLETLIERVTV